MPSTDTLKHFDNSSSSLLQVPDVRVELLQSLTTLVEGCPPRKPWDAAFLQGRCGGLFTGPTSIALLFFHLSRSHPELEIRGKSPSAWCTRYLECSDGLSKSKASLESDGCGITNEFLAFCVVKAAFENDSMLGKQAVDALREVKIDAELTEWMKGGSGALYLLRFLRTHVPSLTDAIRPVQKALIDQLLISRPWTFRGKRYLGAAHGDIGILTQAVLTDPDSAASFEVDLVAMLDAQEEDGNWPIRPNGDSLVQFCHGAPGFIFSLERLREHYPQHQKRIDAAIARGQECTWAKGLLKKEPNLCHGATGNALALEGSQLENFMAEATAEKIAKGRKDGIYETSNDPWCLLWGEAGRAWSWAILDERRGGRHTLNGVVSYTDV